MLFHKEPHSHLMSPEAIPAPAIMSGFQIEGSQNEMRRACSLPWRKPLEIAHTACVYILLARTWSQRRLGIVVLILGGHVSNQKFYTESGTDLEEHPAAFAIRLGWEAMVHHIYNPL